MHGESYNKLKCFDVHKLCNVKILLTQNFMFHNLTINCGVNLDLTSDLLYLHH